MIRPAIKEKLKRFLDRETEISAMEFNLNRLREVHRDRTKKDFGIAHGDVASIPNLVKLVLKVHEQSLK